MRFFRRGQHVLSIKIHIGGDAFEVSGDMPLPEVLPLIATWYAERKEPDQRVLDQLTQRLKAANTKLQGDVVATSPSS